MAYRIVLTGAPGSGKTEILEHLKTLPELHGFAFFDELARQLLAANPSLRQRRKDLHLAIWTQQTARERDLHGGSFVTDRGTLDAFAFHPELLELVNSTVDAEYARYTDVIHLGSAAHLGEPYYVCDTIRTESCADALIIEHALDRAWSAHPHYQYIAAQKDFGRKIADATTAVQEILASSLSAHQ